jgi:hypothetical protein
MRRRSIFEYRKNHAVTLLKNYETTNVVRYVPTFLVLTFLQGVFKLITSFEPTFIESASRMVWWLLRNSRELYLDRLFVQEHVRRVTDEERIIPMLVRPRIPLELLSE